MAYDFIQTMFKTQENVYERVGGSENFKNSVLMFLNGHIAVSLFVF